MSFDYIFDFDFEDQPVNTVYNNSIFVKYFAADDANAVAWAENVLQKLIAKEIVPNYILREYETLPTDYETLFRPTALFFSYLVTLAREFREFKQNGFLADQYLLNKGHFTTGDDTLNRLLFIISNLLRVRAQRGTIKMIEKSIDPNIPHGEMLRLINWNEPLFFKLGVAQSKRNGWNINNSGPLHRGCTGRYDLNIGYEYTENVVDLNAYPLINDNYVYLTTEGGRDCIEITGVPVSESAGIGLLSDVSKRITVTPELNFEITFFVSQDINLEQLTFGCVGFDADGSQVSLKNVTTEVDTDFFFEKKKLNQTDKFYMIRGIIYNKDQAFISSEDAKLNIGFGGNLKFVENVVSIMPIITLQNDDGLNGSIFISNIKVTPCSLPYSRCYLNNKNFIDIILTNKNGKYTNDQINDILRKYFIPYNTAFKTLYFDSIIDIGSFLLLESGDYFLLENDGQIPLE